MAGQVWSKANFDGIDRAGYKGGPGSVLATTRQHFGVDGIPNTPDDLFTPMSEYPGVSSIDERAGSDCTDMDDRVRGFAGHHPGGVVFVFGDGSVHFLAESMDNFVYTGQSTIRGGEVLEAID